MGISTQPHCVASSALGPSSAGRLSGLYRLPAREVVIEVRPKLEAVVKTCLVFDLDFDLERFAFRLLRHRHFQHAILVRSLDSVVTGVLGHCERSAHRA